ncbi:hypothetical protein LDENG_00235080 [Lucifuga dentata]|nr:hypothetical protein LDENG_00235080 [Lucifuga dentata]
MSVDFPESLQLEVVITGMEILKHGLTAFALIVTLYILETQDFTKLSSLVSSVHFDHFDEDLLHTREKRNVHADEWNYVVDVLVDVANIETVNQIRSFVNAASLPLQLGSTANISDISITTVCSQNGNGSQCRCEDKFAWPHSSCVTYGTCDHFYGGICQCINAFPVDGQYCQPASALLALVEYEVDVELNVLDFETVDNLRILLENGNFSLALSPTVNITHIDMTTVCYPNGASFQCRCEDHFVWPYNNCVTYGVCDDIINDTCGCINSVPSNGQYCQPKTVDDIFQLFEYIIEAEINVSDITVIERLRDSVENTIFPIPLSNTINITKIDFIFTVVYEYEISIEVNTTDTNQLRNALSSLTFPFPINAQVNISDADITTVCFLSTAGFQCSCEDQYRWSCDQCFLYGHCDTIINSTCGCINAFPRDGQYCQSVDRYNFTACPPPPPPPVIYEYVISVELNATDVSAIEQLRDTVENIIFPIVLSNTINITKIDFIFTVVYEYEISIEVNTTDTNQLRNALSSLTFPFPINAQVNISDADITTVCRQVDTGFQCRCEDDYLLPCDKCATYGKCEGNTSNTCGCIGAIPIDRQYCQSIHHHNFTTCPTPTPPVIYEYVISVELNTTDVSAIERLRDIVENTIFPITLSNSINITKIDFIFTVPQVLYEYEISIEVNITDTNQLRNAINNLTFPFSINAQVNISDADITTVCRQVDTGFQCRCEDDYLLPCDKCATYGKCEGNTSNTCGCIGAIPIDRQYCQSIHHHNFTTCPTPTPPVIYEYVISVELNTTDVSAIERLRDIVENTIFPITLSNSINITKIDFIFTVPQVLYEYEISIEVNITDTNQLRNAINNLTFPFSINAQVNISDADITTVCFLSTAGFQCRCEDQYRWSCDQCFLYGHCDTIINSTCGCINAFPRDGQYCQSVDQYSKQLFSDYVG